MASNLYTELVLSRQVVPIARTASEQTLAQAILHGYDPEPAAPPRQPFQLTGATYVYLRHLHREQT